MVYTSDYPFVFLTADVVALTLAPADGLQVLLVKRGSAPHRHRWALPGGFVEDREPVERAARRELREETGVAGRWLGLTEIGAYTAPGRDPRHRTVSVAFLAPMPWGAVDLVAGDDAADARFWPVAEMRGSRRLAFDHATILDDALTLLGDLMERTGVAARLLPPQFTVAALREVYEAVWETDLDPGNFQRRVTGADGFVEPTGELSTAGRGRPAQLYRAHRLGEISPRMSRPARSS